MKKLLVSLVVLLFSIELFSAEYAVISSKNFSELSLNQIKALYLKKTQYLSNQKVVVLNLSANNEIRKSFERNILHMSFPRLKSYWAKQHYLGHRPPITLKSQKSIKTFLKKVQNSIGYIALDKIDDKSIILYKWSD